MNADMLMYWIEVANYIENQRQNNNTISGEYTPFADTVFVVEGSIFPKQDHKEIPDGGIVQVIPIDGPETIIRDRCCDADQDIELAIQYVRPCTASDIARQQICVANLQALKDCLRRFEYHGKDKTLKLIQPYQTETSLSLMWQVMQNKNMFTARFSAFFSNTLGS